MGKIVHQHRDVNFFSNVIKGYYYSGQIAQAEPLPDWLDHLMRDVNLQFGTNFNAVLVNKYRDGSDYISSHADSAVGLVQNSPVASISLGATRTFRIRDNEKKIVLDLPLKSGDFLMMGGLFQQDFRHEVPIEKKVKDCRICFTFREHVEVS